MLAPKRISHLPQPDEDSGPSIKEFHDSHLIAGRAIIEGTRERATVWVSYNDLNKLYWVTHLVEGKCRSYCVIGDIPLKDVIVCSHEIMGWKEETLD